MPSRFTKALGFNERDAVRMSVRRFVLAKDLLDRLTKWMFASLWNILADGTNWFSTRARRYCKRAERLPRLRDGLRAVEAMTIADLATRVQYRILRRIAPKEPGCMSGTAYDNRVKVRIVLGEPALQELRGKVVIDFGCGEGNEAIELANFGAARVIGIDIRTRVIDRAREKAARAGVAERCEFCTDTDERADAIVSIDSFEHFSDPLTVLRKMADLLKPNGAVFASFGPTWYHPLGGHLFSVFPWAHLIFSEPALIRWRADIRNDGATRFTEVEGGLNRMTIRAFLRLTSESPFSVEKLDLVPIRKLKFIHNRLTREFTTALVRCKLVKKQAS
jgi:SAM-dependent methyltransferase